MAISALWRQWSIINPAASTRGTDGARRILDPEALILASAALADRERRFVDLLAWLAERGSGLLSVQRTRTLADALPGAGEGAKSFAHWAMHRGADRRWRSLANEPRTAEPRSGKGPALPRLDDRAALLLRMRAGFGVGVKADLLAYLVCMRGETSSAIEMAGAIGYTDKTVRVAAREMRLAGLVEETGDYPARYAVPPGFAEAFVELLYGRTGEGVPEWCFWPQVFAFLLHVCTWQDDAKLAGDAYLASSHARDLFSRFEGTFRTLRVRMPRPEPHAGARYLPIFAEFVAQLESWMER